MPRISSVSTEPKLRPGYDKNSDSISGNGEGFHFLNSVKTMPGAYPGSYSVVIGSSLPGIKQLGREANTDLILEQRLRMCGSIPLLLSVLL